MPIMAPMLEMEPRVLFWVATVCYTVAFFLSVKELRIKKKGAFGWGSVWVALGFLAQSGGMVWLGLKHGGCPVGNVFEVALFFVWSLAGLYLLLGGIYRSVVAGALVSLLTTVTMALAMVFSTANENALGGGKMLLSLHAALGIFSYGILGMLTLSAAMYLWQAGSLRRRNPEVGMAGYLPSLRVLDRVSLRLLMAGLVLLAISLSVGIWEWKSGASISMSKAFLGGSVFALYALLLVFRLKKQLLARRFAWICIVLFVLVLASLYFVHKAVAMALTGGATG